MKARAKRRAAAPSTTPRHPFVAIPVVAEGVEARWDGQTPIQLRRELRPGRGLGGLLARRFGFRREIRVNLDERGSWFWRQIDGETDLGEIERRMRGQFSLSAEEGKKAAILFVKMLMTRHLIWLKVPQPGKDPERQETR